VDAIGPGAVHLAGWLANLLLLLHPACWHTACCSAGGGTPSKTRQGSLASAGGSIKPTAKEQGRFKVYEGDEPPPFRCAPHHLGCLAVWLYRCLLAMCHHFCACLMARSRGANTRPA
jgi:hypothetical protein